MANNRRLTAWALFSKIFLHESFALNGSFYSGLLGKMKQNQMGWVKFAYKKIYWKYVRYNR